MLKKTSSTNSFSKGEGVGAGINIQAVDPSISTLYNAHQCTTIGMLVQNKLMFKAWHPLLWRENEGEVKQLP